MKYLELEVPGAGSLKIGVSPHCMCGGRVGFEIGVSWGQYGYSGGVLPRSEAEKLLIMLNESLSSIKETEKEEYDRMSREMAERINKMR